MGRWQTVSAESCIGEDNRDRELAKAILSQKEWIASCGGDLAGYIAKYSKCCAMRVPGRGFCNIVEIYEADTHYLNKLLTALITGRYE